LLCNILLLGFTSSSRRWCYAEILIRQICGGEGRGCQTAERPNELPGGKVSFSVSGGFLAKGHPVGCTGLAQIVEAVWQLQGEAGRRQVENARVALTHTMGGLKVPDAKAVTVSILQAN